jgi:hypothetical protein
MESLTRFVPETVKTEVTFTLGLSVFEDLLHSFGVYFWIFSTRFECVFQAQTRKTKIICTMGPSCWDVDMIVKLMDEGMSVAR